MNQAGGLLLIRKPGGMTSHDVVAVVRRKLGLKRVGHTGTLDPMAEGLLVVLVGPATKRQGELQGHDKSYEATLCLGTQTDTGDADGTPVRSAPVPPIDRPRLETACRAFIGEILQTPPAYSAVKVAGRPAYWWARRHQPVTLSPRAVRVFALTVAGWTPETVTFRVDCSAGTYIRTLGEAIAEQLGTVGHLTRLIRSRVGAWRVEDARPLSWLTEASVEAVMGELRPAPAEPAAAR